MAVIPRKKKSFPPAQKKYHQACVGLQRELKKVRSFVIQKITKDLKQGKETEEETNMLQCIKRVCLSDVAKQLLREIGMVSGVEGESKAEVEQVQKVDEAVLERFRLHGHVQAFLEPIQTEIRKAEDKEMDQLEKKRSRRGDALTLIGGRNAAPPTSVFLSSLSGEAASFESRDGFHPRNRRIGAEENGSEDDIAEFLGEKKRKKNRPGQRARRDKALERERLENDQLYGKKRRTMHSHSTATTRAGNVEVKSVVSSQPHGKAFTTHNKNKDLMRTGGEEEDASAHPSWAAKKALKDKEKVDIHAFAGKKITFGDD